MREEDGWEGTVTGCTAYSLRKQAPCRSEKGLVLLNVGLRINAKETQFVRGPCHAKECGPSQEGIK